MKKPPDLIACYWTIGGNYVFGDNDDSPWDFKLRAEAASRAGYKGVGLKHADLMKTVRKYGYAGVRSILNDNGLRMDEVEALFDWCSSGERRKASDIVRADLLKAAAEFGAHHLKVAGDFTPNASQEIGPMHDEFQRLARQAKDAGTTVSLEPIAFSNVPTLANAVAIVGEAAGNGGGVMLDAWHVTRGKMPFAEIARLPKGAIAGAELDDGTLETVGDPVSDTLDRRRFCGEGEFDLKGFIAAVTAAGYDGPWGVEIISSQLRAMPLEEAAQRTYATSRAQF